MPVHRVRMHAVDRRPHNLVTLSACQRDRSFEDRPPKVRTCIPYVSIEMLDKQLFPVVEYFNRRFLFGICMTMCESRVVSGLHVIEFLNFSFLDIF